MRTLIKWCGGKQALAPLIVDAWRSGKHKRLVEPFAGGASLFFEAQPKRALLVDRCQPLVDFYHALYHVLPQFLACWGLMTQRYPPSEENFYDLRERLNIGGHYTTATERAALFLYINRVGYQGLWRVNKEGRCNVPYGHYEDPWLPGRSDIIEVANLLRNAHVVCGDFEKALLRVGPDDFVFCDPPYHEAYDGYTTQGFSFSDQERLAASATLALDAGATVVISNKDCSKMRSLYPATRWECLEMGVVQRIAPQNGGKKPEMILVGKN